jgi:hypothetical protein
MVTSGGGSPSNSAVARCTASSVRIGSTGKGWPTRASTASVTATTKQRRANTRSPRTAASSCAGAKRPLVRARTIARAASASVNADVTSRPSACSAFSAISSPSRSAASSALDSTYRMPVAVVAAGWGAAVTGRAPRARPRLRFATVAVDQVGGGSPWKPDVRPRFEGVTGLDGRANDTFGDELVEPTSTTRSRCRAGGNKLGDDTAVCRDRDTLARLDPAYVATQVVFQLADACRCHNLSIATCSHIGKRSAGRPHEAGYFAGPILIFCTPLSSAYSRLSSQMYSSSVYPGMRLYASV